MRIVLFLLTPIFATAFSVPLYLPGWCPHTASLYPQLIGSLVFPTSPITYTCNYFILQSSPVLMWLWWDYTHGSRAGRNLTIHLDSSPSFEGNTTDKSTMLAFYKDRKDVNPLEVCGSSKFQQGFSHITRSCIRCYLPCPFGPPHRLLHTQNFHTPSRQNAATRNPSCIRNWTEAPPLRG